MNFDTMLLSCNHSQAPQIKTSTKIQKNGNYPYYHEINNTVRLNILLWSADLLGNGLEKLWQCVQFLLELCSAPSVSQLVFKITEKAPTRAFSWLKAATTALIFENLLRRYAKRT